MNPFLTLIVLIFFIQFASGQNHYTDVSEMLGIPIIRQAEAISVIDFDKDGDEDIYVCIIDAPNMLLQNNGINGFEDIAPQLELDFGEKTKVASWGDFDNDGFLDLYIAKILSADIIMHNNGDGTFTDITINSNIFHLGKPLSVNLADLNNDGLLDIYVSNFSQQNALFINLGDNFFYNAIWESGALDTGLAMGTIIFDYDRDGDLDIYLTHDGSQPNILYQNDGNAIFTNVSATSNSNTQSMAMGVDIADINNDGFLDIYIANLGANILLLNNTDGTFTDISQTAQVDDPGMGWGVSFLDFDNDSHVDIYIANESNFSAYPNVLYKNMGDNTFQIVEEQHDISSMGGSYSTVALDYNLDGQVDLILGQKDQNDQLRIFQNPLRNNNWIKLHLIAQDSTNSYAIGAKVIINRNEDHSSIQEIHAGNSWLSQKSPILHFGLKQDTQANQIEIQWPNGDTQIIKNLPANHIYTVFQNDTIINYWTYNQHQVPEDPTDPSTHIPIREPKQLNSQTGTATTTLDFNNIKIYPNPTSQFIYLDFTNSLVPDSQLKLIDPQGKIIYCYQLRAKQTSIDLKRLNMTNGIYQLQIQTNEYQHSQAIFFMNN